ncbi:STY4528 family pathogenicity island replication protein [Yersinia rochesterensis]|uniref:STY4528 family pathogenicity island replication protein n=1 Tax=Yersinia rochesterensis TaxID=1604335 RepID=UPI0004F64B14|nr:STY4528 family pathogenicity island replication protein [Yersinia rochesterensis]AIN18414.1 helix-turn-helix domain protein [Yersinia rochesterensis]
MVSPVLDNVIQHTLSKMAVRIAQKTQSGVAANEQSGLVFLGNVHDAIPRQLFLDERLSALDKMAWVMIRLYAQQNEGAVFPTYDELQQQLAAPHSDKASRETVSRTLLMLRLTGWLSLCKRVRDNGGRVRGNIYAQHDEPVGFRDAEYFDPGWLDTVAQACRHGNKSVRLTALAVLHDIKTDTAMRHRHSRIAMFEARLSAPQTPKDFAKLRHTVQLQPSSNTELSQNRRKLVRKSLSSISEHSLKTKSYSKVRKSNRYVVRSSTQGVKDTYVAPEAEVENQSPAQLKWPQALIEHLTTQDRDCAEPQLLALPEKLGQYVLDDVAKRIGSGEVRNVAAYLLGTLKRARNGQFNTIASLPTATASAVPPTRKTIAEPQNKPEQKRAKPESISKLLAEIRTIYLQT